MNDLVQAPAANSLGGSVTAEQPSMWDVVSQGFTQLRNEMSVFRSEVITGLGDLRRQMVLREVYDAHREADRFRMEDVERRLTETAQEVVDQDADEARYRDRMESLVRQQKEALEAKIAAQDAANILALEAHKKEIAEKRRERRTGLFYPLSIALCAAFATVGLDALVRVLS